MPTARPPGVHIEEFTPGAPIEGVGTSTAAFIGPASSGELDIPTKITSWDQFKATFGRQPLPGFHLWYSVRGFFENGGKVCYVVRASNGDYAKGDLTDSSTTPKPLIRIRARQPGKTPSIKVEVVAAHLVPNTTLLFQPATKIAKVKVGSPREMELALGKGADFKPGDWVKIGTASERLQILSISGDALRLASDPSTAPAAGNAFRLADTLTETQTVRIRPAAVLTRGAIEPGTMLTITQSGKTVAGIIATVQSEPLAADPPSYRVTFRSGLGATLNLDPFVPAKVQSQEFDLKVTAGAGTPIEYLNLSIEPAHPRFFQQIVEESRDLILAELVEPPPAVAMPLNLPKAGTITLTPGEDEDLSTLTGSGADVHFQEALDTLREIDDVNLVAIPDRITPAMQQALITHCELLGDRFAVLDALPPAPDQLLFGANSIEAQRPRLDSMRGYGALYYPWLRVPPLGAGRPILVPPSGHVCGIIARSDDLRGVHKAPANEIVNGAVGVERTMNGDDRGQLNDIGVNIIRIPKGGGRPQLFGARTTATDRGWQYVNIRRLFLFLEASIQEGIRWAVFEPNNLQLWQKLRRTITEFLTRVWRDGGLFGAKAEDAFYVRIDEVLNPFSEQALGRLHIEIGVRPTYPAEFIVVRIGIWPGGSEVSEA